MIFFGGAVALSALIGSASAVAQQPGPATPGKGGTLEVCPSDTADGTKVYDNGNLHGVLNGPSAPTMFSVARPICVTSIMTYHYNGGRGAPAGWVGLRDATGRLFGPWWVSARKSADGRQGDGRHGLYWFVSPQIVLPAGNYTVVDSDQATWSHNEQSGRRGITHLFAKAAIRVAATSPSPAPQPKANPPTSAPPVTTTRPPAPLPSIAADKPKPATPTPTQPAQPSSPATQASVPVAPNIARVLKPFTGYKTQDTCAQANLKLDGAPWRNGDDGATGPVETSRLGKYQGLLRHTMRGLRLFYGTMTPVEERNFDAFWAPFFDHPTAAALDYFEKITPLLDVMAATLTTLDGMLPEFGEALQDAVITDADPLSGAVALAGTLHRQVKSERAKLDELAKTIEALGNPPDPLAAKCRAQKLHRKAVGAPAKPSSSAPSALLFDFLATIRPWKIDVSAVKGGRRYNVSSDARGPNYPYVPTYRRTVKGDTIVFATVEAGFGEPNCGLMTRQSQATPASWRRHTIEFRFNADRSRILELIAREELQICKFDKIGSESKVPGVISGKTWLELSSATTEVWSEFHARDLAVGHFRARAPEIRNGVHIYSDNAKNRIVSARSAEWQPEGRRSDLEDDVRIDYVSVPFYTAASTSGRPGTQEWMNWKGHDTRVRADGTPLWDWLNKQAAAVAAADAQSTTSQTRSEQAGRDAPSTGPQSALADDPALKAEAIAYHLALAEQIRRDADRWAADAQRETNKDRRDELLKRALEMRANAQAEQDIADSLRTGVVVHTRTEWDNAQQRALVASIKAELAAFDAEARILRNVPKLEDMLDAAGVAERDAVNKRIAEAIRSPDASKRLEAIYGEIRNKVVDQGVRRMAAEQARVEMWDRRVQIAEAVQETASLAIMLTTLWNPAQMGSLALGFAGATGVAEDGIKGGAKAVVRSVSGKADAVISAYEGATRIDPATGQPGGAWGAVEGALWSIGTDKAMAAAGARIQQAKAHYTAAAQAAGRPVIKPVAKATREARIKEFDFKTPEERFHAELTNARTPAEQAAVRKKHAIQVEREAMAKDMDAAREAAEDAVRKGADPVQTKGAYNRDLAAIHDTYKARETRNAEHQQVMKELGFDQNYDRTNTDVRPTGSNPATASSDMDFTPYGATPHEAYQKGKRYTEAMKKRGHNIVEYGDRWVDTTTDATIWKPGFAADRPGSSSFEAGVIFGTLPHSDKFGTTGGIEWTSTGKTPDPLGAVLANTGKAVAAGVGSAHPVDLHTVGKSALKAAEASGVDVEPGFLAQIKALRAHQTPEQAGVLTLGADRAAKDKETKAFLDKVQTLLAQSYTKAKATSDANIAGIEKQAAGKSNPNEAYVLRAQAKGSVAGNDAALTTIAKVAPVLTARMTADASGNPTPNRGGLARGLAQDRQAAVKAPPLPADGRDKAFAGVSERCKDAVARVESKRAAAKPGSDEARYLADLKAAMEQGAANPAVAIRTVRALSGFELPVILAELGVPPAATK